MIPGPSTPPAGQAVGARGGRLLIFGATLFWGLSATLARFVFRDRHVPPLTVVELRLALAALPLGAWLAWRRRERLYVAREDWPGFAVLGILGLAAVQGSYYYTISVLGVGLAILIQYLAPSLIVVFDVMRGTRAGGKTIAAVIAALAGTALLVGNLDPMALRATPLQWAIGFSSALSFAFFIVYSKRPLTRYAPETVLFYTFSTAGVFWAIVTPPWKILAAGYDAEDWGLFLLLAVFSTLVPFSLFYAGLRRMPAAQVGIIATLEPVVAVVSAAVALGETLRPLQNLGALLVLAAASLSYGRAVNSPPSSPPHPDAAMCPRDLVARKPVPAPKACAGQPDPP